MAIIVNTAKPKLLLKSIEEKISKTSINTWTVDSDGDFTHSTEQWMKKAWLRPKIFPGEKVVFNIFPPVNTTMSTTVYAIYHGRFIEMLLAHFDGNFTNVTSTAMPESPDKTKA